MKRLLWHWVISALALFLTAQVLHPGVTITPWYHVLWLAPLLGLVNVVVGLLAKILSLVAFPVNLLTLGCFGFLLSFVIYIGAIWFLGNTTGALRPMFQVNTFLAAAELAVVMALFGSVLNMLLPGKKGK